MGSKSEAAAVLRAYAKQQGQLARDYRAGKVHPVFYRLDVVKNGREIKAHCQPGELTEAERKRQINEAVRHAERARLEANKEAQQLEGK